MGSEIDTNIELGKSSHKSFKDCAFNPDMVVYKQNVCLMKVKSGEIPALSRNGYSPILHQR